MMARTNVNVSGLGSFLRNTVSTIGVSGLPRIFLTASLSDMPRTCVSSSFVIRSPLFKPALNAGLSSIGDTTFTKPSSMATSIPNPPNSPCVPACKSLKASASIKVECGSKPASMPVKASLMSFLSSTGST